MQLRYLQTLTEIAAERNSTLIFPASRGAVPPFLRDEVRWRVLSEPDGELVAGESPVLNPRLDPDPGVHRRRPGTRGVSASWSSPRSPSGVTRYRGELVRLLMRVRALGAVGERSAFVPLARTVPAEDPQGRGLQARSIPKGSSGLATREAPNRLQGFGALEAIAGELAGRAAVRSGRAPRASARSRCGVECCCWRIADRRTTRPWSGPAVSSKCRGAGGGACPAGAVHARAGDQGRHGEAASTVGTSRSVSPRSFPAPAAFDRRCP